MVVAPDDRLLRLGLTTDDAVQESLYALEQRRRLTAANAVINDAARVRGLYTPRSVGRQMTGGETRQYDHQPRSLYALEGETSADHSSICPKSCYQPLYALERETSANCADGHPDRGKAARSTVSIRLGA